VRVVELPLQPQGRGEVARLGGLDPNRQPALGGGGFLAAGLSRDSRLAGRFRFGWHAASCPFGSAGPSNPPSLSEICAGSGLKIARRPTKMIFGVLTGASFGPFNGAAPAGGSSNG